MKGKDKIGISFLAILFTLLNSLSAQGGWKKRHFLANAYDAACRDVIEAPNGNIIAAGISTDSTLGAYKLTILGMDPNGNVLWKKLYGDSNTFYYNNDQHLRGPIVYDNSGFYHALAATDSTFKRTFGVLIKFDYNGDTLWQRKYKSTDTLEDVIPQGLTNSVDGGFLMTGLFQHWGQSTSKCLLIKTDKNGVELWRKKIGKSAPDVQDGKSLVQDSATKKIVIVGAQYLPTSNDDNIFGNIIITDSLGSKILQTTFSNGGDRGFWEVIQLKDKNFVVSGVMNANSPLGNLKRYRSLAVKFNINGSVMWSNMYDTLSFFTGIFSLYEFPNQDLLLAGILDTMLNHNISIESRIKIRRTDSQGNTIWSKYVGDNSRKTDEVVRSLNPTKDGGFVIAVWDILGSSNNPFSIIKIDSTGCDTLEQYCREMELTIEKQKVNWVEFELFPNPAGNVVQIRFYRHANQAFKLSISDLSGRIIKEQIVQTIESQELNTSSFSPGTYIVNIVSEGKVMGRKKLVVTH